ncbi:MAG: hypothetical protein KBT35_05890 [Firmicutes bacterium]|nr:hypothetical protein [Candidatus Colivicinus equi]
MNKEFTVKEFVDKYNSIATDNLKEKFIRDNLEIKNYIGFSEKCSLAKRIINVTTFEKDENGKDTGNIKVDSVSRYLLFTLSVIDKYTNINVDFKKVTEEYDELNSNGLIELFVGEKSIIPLKEYSELQTLLNMILDDTLQNNMSTQAFIQNQVTRFGTLVGITLSPIMNNIADNLNNMDEKTVEKLGKQIEKLMKKTKYTTV